MPDKNFLLELALVTAVGVAIAKITQAVPVLNDKKTLTRTGLYVLGYYVATRRPAGGYKLLETK